MKAKINLKSLMAGVLIGITLSTSISVFGNVGNTVQAWLQDNVVSIYIDGTKLTMTEDNHILNYNGRVYTPTRAVVEAMGGTVDWEEARQAVIIKSPEPEVIEIEVEKEVEKEKEKEKESTKNTDKDKKEDKTSKVSRYFELPVKQTISKVRIDIINQHVLKESRRFEVEVKNEHDSYIFVRYEDAYLEIDGVQYISDNRYSHQWIDFLGADKERVDVSMAFMDVPNDAKEAMIVIPVELHPVL